METRRATCNRAGGPVGRSIVRIRVQACIRACSTLFLAFGLLAGCTQSSGTVGEQLKEAATGKKSTSSTPDANKEIEDAKNLGVRTLDPRTTRARRALRRNFAKILDREPLGFNAELLEWGQEEVERLGEHAAEFPELVRRSTPLSILLSGLPFLIVAIFLAAYMGLTQQIGRLTHHLQAQMHFEFSRWTTRVLRGLILVAGRVTAVAFLVVLSYFPVRAIFGLRPWTELLTETLWLLLTYRAVASAFEALFSGRILAVEETYARRLERLAVAGVRIVVGFLIVLRWIEILGYPAELTAAVTFAFRLTLISFPIALYRARDAVLDLLPDNVESHIYKLIDRAITVNYRWFLIATAVLLAFRAAGYVRAADFILVRGYALLGLVILSFALYANFREYVTRRLDPTQEETGEPTAEAQQLQGPDRGQLSRHLQRLVGLALFLAVTTLSLRLLLLLEPTIILLKIPFVAVGDAEISTLTLLNVGFVVFGTVLATKLIRALLNAQVYPLFEVDVGVAYAINTIAKYILILVGFFLAIAALGVDLTAVTVVLASLGVGIGFGLQTLVENLISGFILLFGRSVEKGDYITVEGTYGQVQAVGARSVVVKTPDNFEMLIPSKEIVGGRIINWSYDDNLVRARVGVGVSYDSEPRQVREVLLETCDHHEHILDQPEPSVLLTEFDDSSVNFELLFFFDCRDTTEPKVIGELNFAIWRALEEADITIPFPQRDLHIKSEEDWDQLEAFVEERGEDEGGRETS